MPKETEDVKQWITDSEIAAENAIDRAIAAGAITRSDIDDDVISDKVDAVLNLIDGTDTGLLAAAIAVAIVEDSIMCGEGGDSPLLCLLGDIQWGGIFVRNRLTGMC